MKSDFDPKQILSFNELPEAVKEEFSVQNEDDFEFDPHSYRFRAVFASYEQITEELDEAYGPNLIDAVEDKNIRQLASNIKKFGMRQLPIGSDGNHRKLAHHYLGIGMWRYQVIPLSVDYLA